MGVVNQLSSTVDATTTTDGDIVFGVDEFMQSTSPSVCDVEATLTLGIVESLSATITSTSTTSAPTITEGAIEELTATGACESFVTGFIITGIGETFTSSITLQSVIPDIPLSIDIELDSSISITSLTSTSTLVIGIIEELSATCIPTVVIPGVGTDITCFSSSLVQSVVEANLELGALPEEISGSVSCSTEADASTLTIEILAGRGDSTYDLQYWYSKYVATSSLNKAQLPFLSQDDPHFENRSFVELLFNDNYSDSAYRYLYREETSRGSWPTTIRERLMVNPSSAKYFVCDSDSTAVCNINLYGLISDDIILLDRLLVYRLEPQNATLVGINYDSLRTTLSKMIYLYIDLKINGNFAAYDHEALISSAASILEQCYESYLIENMFNAVSERGV